VKKGKKEEASARQRFMVQYEFLRRVGGSNFRDLGGHPTRLGRRVRAGQVFRSAHLAAVPEGSGLRAVNLRTLVTLQSRMEVSWLGGPDTTLFGKVRWVHIPIGDAWFEDRESIIVTREGRGHLVLVTEFKEAWQRFFRVLAERKVYPLLFHCSAGRDRTGVGAAMLLDLLGVERNRIVKDFLKSNTVFPKELLSAEMLEPVFDLIDSSGGIEKFVGEFLGLKARDVDSIRRDLIEE
jgi:protein-tyrosine phosphatase